MLALMNEQNNSLEKNVQGRKKRYMNKQAEELGKIEGY